MVWKRSSPFLVRIIVYTTNSISIVRKKQKKYFLLSSIENNRKNGLYIVNVVTTSTELGSLDIKYKN